MFLKKTRKNLFFVWGIALLSQSLNSAIFRPTNNLEFVQAINTANATPADDIIDLQGNVFDFSVGCTDPGYGPSACTSSPNGTNALPVITSRMSIINGRIHRQITAETFRFFEVLGSGRLTLFNITLNNGHAIAEIDPPLTIMLAFPGDDGGAVYNAGILDIQNCNFSHNRANNSGGAIYNLGQLDIQSSVFNSNIADAVDSIGPTGTYAGGGAIFNAGITGVIESMDNSTCTHNYTAGFGGCLNNQNLAANIFSSTFSYNACCTSITGAGECLGDAEGAATGLGGGIYNFFNALVEIIECTIAHNSAFQGGGIYLDGLGFVPDKKQTPSAAIFNSTISKNIAYEGGGGIFINSTAFVAAFISNILAGNTSSNELSEPQTPDIQQENPSSFGFESYNFVGVVNGSSLGSDPASHDIVGTLEEPLDPLLLDLDWNGGFTQTMALNPGSRALNNGLNGYVPPLRYDQRGARFYRVQCGRVDIGAYEAQVCF